MLIPASAPGRFGIEFHDSGSNNFYGIYDWFMQIGSEEEGDRPRFGYRYNDPDSDTISAFSLYPNWMGEQSAGVPSVMARLLDFVHVPTKFAGTRAAEGTIVREPGKINLNTVTEEGWETLRNNRDLSVFPSYTDFRTCRQWSPIANDPNYPSEFRPFRSPSATNLVPPLLHMPPGGENALVGTPASTTWLSLGDLAGNKVLIADDAINPYMALENAMRLSDVTTTRSNVFAIWITVGYFNVERFENYGEWHAEYGTQLSHITTPAMFDAVYSRDNEGYSYMLGAEKGLGDGTVIRHRAFYLIDRSSPLIDDQNDPVIFYRGIERNNVRSVIIGEISL